jgi:cyclomaltodextrinase / maltogenic alpha-amylase / neopullulanase
MMNIQTPDWVKHAIFYQIFPDSFARKVPQHQQWLLNVKLEKWDAPPTFQGYKGGNLWGVIEKLDYLQDLGINAIYFTPIFQSASNHRYHTHDYYQIDPLLGGNEAFLALLEAAHQRNLKVVLDGVFNHASRGFFFFNDILENGSNSPWLDWFKIEDWPLVPYDGDRPANYISWNDYRALPEFNHDHPAVREYIMQIAEYWLKIGIDGWRLDVPYCIKTPGFWQEFRQRVKAINPDAYIVGEVWTDSREWLDGTQFDGVMNYLFAVPTIAFTAGDRVISQYFEHPDYQPLPSINAREYQTKIETLLNLYPWEIQLTQLNLLNSHDTARLITSVGDDQATVDLATLLLFTFPGAPSIYYGDEVGLGGGSDPDCRRGFPSESNWNQEILENYRQLISLRQQYICLRIGKYEALFAEGMVYLFARSLEMETVIIAINAGLEVEQVKIPVVSDQNYDLIYGEGKLELIEQMLCLTIPPRKGLVIA